LYSFLDTGFRDKEAAGEIREVLEKSAGTLKVWMGEKQGQDSGLGKSAKVNVAMLCVEVLSWLVGMKDMPLDDQGYETMSEGVKGDV
jgi:hypothetical protein